MFNYREIKNNLMKEIEEEKGFSFKLATVEPCTP